MNHALFLWLNGLAGRSPFFDTLIYFAAHDLIFFLVVGYLVFVWQHATQKRPRLIVVTILVVLMAFQLASIIHTLYPEPRPQLTNVPVNVLITLANTKAFPSEHTMIAFLLAGLVWCYPSGVAGKQKRLGIAYFSGATIIGLSRIVAGVHWPGDVLAGMVIGLVFGYLGNLLLD